MFGRTIILTTWIRLTILFAASRGIVVFMRREKHPECSGWTLVVVDIILFQLDGIKFQLDGIKFHLDAIIK